MEERWNNRIVFVVASIGSAIGLGNIWRFPYICFKYGGGAFLIPFVVALLTTGIPLLILEFSLGYKMSAGAPESFRKTGEKKEWLGWLALLIASGIVTYYVVIMGWCVNYLYYSFNLSWGSNTEEFFYNKFLGITNGPLEIGKIRLPLLFGLIIAWLCVVGCVWKGTKTVGKVVYFTVFAPLVILVIFVIRGLTLPGAMEGLKYYLTPNFEALKDIEVWRNAYVQVFFSLTLGFGVMIAYASYLPPNRDIVNSAFIIALSDAGISFLGGFAVFSVLGYYSSLQGIPVVETVKGGIPLAFITYPTIINLLPFANILFGVLFFFMLITLAVDSAFSLVEAATLGILNKYKVENRYKINILFIILGILIGLIYITQGGLYWIDIMDYFFSNFGLMIVAFIECIVLGYMFKISILKEYINSTSEIKVGRWWEFCVKIITPLVLLLILALQISERIKAPYGGYERQAEFIGMIILFLLFPLSIILMQLKKRNGVENEHFSNSNACN